MRGKIFSLDEADRMLPLVRRIVVNVRARHRLLRRKRDLIDRLGSVIDVSSIELKALETTCERLQSDIDRYVAELEELGCFLRDPELGICDCYAELDGRIVYVTWQPPARRYEWYHSVETPHVQRVPLPGRRAGEVRGSAGGGA